jgi:hypothetical protein
VAWTDGAFRIDFERRECPQTITHSTQSVLMEALRLFDEAQRDGQTEENPSDSGRGSALSPKNAPSSPFGF